MRPDELARLQLTAPLDAVAAKAQWREALTDAEAFVRERPSEEVGCVYADPNTGLVRAPDASRPLEAQGLVPHFGAPGGVIPRFPDAALRPEA